MRIGRFSTRYEAAVRRHARRVEHQLVAIAIYRRLYTAADVAAIALRRQRQRDRLMNVRRKWWALPWWRRVLA